jgi:carbamoyltransferase
MLEVINRPRSDIPAVTHVDYSARVQTVHHDDKPDFYELLKEFYELTNCPVLVNTSFNVRGEPIVCGPADAYRCFMRTEMDLLVMEDCLLWKNDQPAFKEARDWRTEYELD